MRVGDGARTNLAEEGGERDTDPVRTAVLRVLSNAVAGECHLQVFIKRKLDGDVGQTEQSGCQTRVE